jgi:hypothetical protein
VIRGRLAALADRRGQARKARLAHALRAVPIFCDLPAAELTATSPEAIAEAEEAVAAAF